ncbi:MAG TPA: hypothetical protein DFS52_23415 [Myxococcales bacterium]|jgi:hypothetical protein|nr:hypothetical protein [Myxococcales bacterium]
MSSVYLFCLSLGFVFTVVGAALGHLLGGGDGADGADGAEVDGLDGVDGGLAGVDGGLDVGADVDVGDGDAGGHGSVHLPIFSPTVISFFVFTFGAFGLLFHRAFGIENPWVHTPMASVSAVLSGLGLAFGIYKITSHLESNRIARVSDALGSPVEVTVSVPAVGMGEIAYVSAGTRQTLSARSADGREYKQGASVRVLKIADGVALVSEAPLKPAFASVSPTEPARGEPVRSPTGVRHKA